MTFAAYIRCFRAKISCDHVTLTFDLLTLTVSRILIFIHSTHILIILSVFYGKPLQNVLNWKFFYVDMVETYDLADHELNYVAS